MESCTADFAGTVAAAVTSCSTNASVVGPATGPEKVTVTTNGSGYTLSSTSNSTGVFRITKSSTSPGAYTRSCSGGTKGCNASTW